MLLFTFQDFCWALLVGLLASAIVAVVVELAKKRKESYHIRSLKLHSRVYIAQKSGDVEINVKYKSHEVQSSLLVLNMLLENDGKQDIRFETHFSSGVFIRNPKYSFIYASAISNDVNASCELKEDGALVQWDILKVGESILLKLVVEPKEDTGFEPISETQFFNGLNYEFRSDCIDTIKSEEERSPVLKRITRSPYFMALFGVVVLSMYMFMAMSINVKYSFESEIDNKPVQVSTVLYSSVFDRCVLFKKDSWLQVVRPEEMPITMTFEPIQKNSFDYISSIVIEIMVYLMAFLLICTFILSIIIHRNREKIKDLRSKIE